MTRGIKEIKAELSKLREEYEAKVTALESEMAAVRTARGYVKKTPVYEAYYEPGRSTMPTPSGGMGVQ
jgi:hypothetical protein